MIKSIHIQNFKSVVDLKMDLGSFNVLIGENGCGKSNILEAIAFGAAASADKLDFEFMGSRGIRMPKPEFMFSAFKSEKSNTTINLSFKIEDKDVFFNLINDQNNPTKWIEENKQSAVTHYFKIQKDIQARYESLKPENLARQNESTKLKLDIEDIVNLLNNRLEELYLPYLNDYIIYSPEESSLRKFEDTTQIYPLGIKGEGLFQYLKELAYDKKNSELLKEIKENLSLLDWYEDFKLPDNLMHNEYALAIKDRYLNKDLQYFDQRSTNEGFLFLLFYATLFISKTTPAFFAIDNIDSSFNPKLCMALTKSLAALAKKHKKQVIVTTHNPAILDGLNLKDDNQRLFVVRRNDEGHTKATRVEYKANRTKKLSELWTDGVIGGLPENF